LDPLCKIVKKLIGPVQQKVKLFLSMSNLYKLLLIPAILLSFLVFKKSFLSPITHDEAFSFEEYSQRNVKDILSFSQFISANNHIVNSLYMKFTGALGFEQTGILRLLSSFSFLLFVFSTIGLAKDHSNYWSIGLYLIACSNPYLLDFFSLARGYGFSFGCMAFSIFLYVKGLRLPQSKNIYWAIQMATLGMLSNFNLVYFWSAINLYHAIQFISQRDFSKSVWVKLARTYIFPILSFAYLLFVFGKLQAAQQLYFGSKDGFFKNVIEDQLWCLIYDQNYSWNPQFLLCWDYTPLFLLLVAILSSFFNSVRTNNAYREWIFTLFLALVSVLFIELNHRLLGSLYPIKRTGLFLTVLYSINVLMFFRFLITIRTLKVPTLILSYTLAIVLFVHTLYSYQDLRFREIPYDCHHYEILSVLEKESKPNAVLDLSANWQVGPALNFYRATKSYLWMPKISRDTINPQATYLIVFNEDLPKLETDSLKELLSYPNEGLYLFKRK
jgi:hypothetical protein